MHPWPLGRQYLTIGRDAKAHARQILRDFGFTTRSARRIARMMLQMVSGTKPGQPVKGIQRAQDHDYSVAVPFAFAMTDRTADLRLAVICHMFHVELAGELREAFMRIPGHVDVFISTDTTDKRDSISDAFFGWDKGAVAIRLVPNRGRDIAPKLTAFGDVYARYDLLFFVHSKRTIRQRSDGSTSDQGQAWRHYLLQNLVGSSAVVSSILEAFWRDPGLGIVMAQHWQPIREYIDWHRVFYAARDLARRMGLSLTPGHVIDFPSGSMFWARPAALKPLLDLQLHPEDFPPEAGQTDGTLAHVLERLFLFSCEAAGYRWLKVCDPATTPCASTVVSIVSPGALKSFNQRHGFRLTASKSVS